MAGLVLPTVDYYAYQHNQPQVPAEPVVENIRATAEHATPEEAETALLGRYTLHPNNSPYRSDEDQLATAKEDGTLVVVTKIPKTSTTRAAAIRREIDLLWEIPHPIIPTIFEWLETPENLYYIRDNTERRSLRQLVEASGPVPEDGARDVMTQLLGGVAHLFLHHIAPMRITPENLLFDVRSRMVIGNFDQAVKYSEEKVVGMPYALVTGKYGDDIYTAPEIFEEPVYNARKAVVWSCGVVLYYLTTGQTDRLADLEHPSTLRAGVPTKRRYSVASKINKEIPRIINYPQRSKVPSWTMNLVSKMLLFDPAKRHELIEAAAKVPKMPGDPSQRPLMELAYLDYKYNVGPVGPPIEQLLAEGKKSTASSIFSSNSLTGLLGRRQSWR